MAELGFELHGRAQFHPNALTAELLDQMISRVRSNTSFGRGVALTEAVSRAGKNVDSDSYNSSATDLAGRKHL